MSAQAREVDPRRLLVFREVGRCGSLAGAARKLGWTQPAVSQHVRRLERDLGLPLIIRVGRGVVLTDPGLVLLRHADGVAARLAAASEAMSDLAGLRAGRVRLAAFPSACATIVSAAISGLAATGPELDVRLTQVEPPEAHALLTAGECDIAIVFDYPDNRSDTNEQGELESVPLLDDPLRLVLSPSHPLADRTRISLADLASERWVAGCPRCRQHLIHSAAQAGFVPDIRHSTDDYVVVQSLVAAGLAVALLPALAIAASQHPGVRAVSITSVPPRTISALLMPGAKGVPALTTTLNYLHRAAKAHTAGR